MEPPHDTEAEKVVLGAVMQNQNIAERALGAITASDFYDLRLAAMYNLVTELIAAGKPIDPKVVLGIALERRMRGIDGQFAGELAPYTVVPANIGYYMDRIKDRAYRRWLIGLARQLAETAGGDYEKTPQAIAEQAALALEQRSVGDGATLVIPTMDQFLDAELREYDWLIPGLLERSERIILTAPESWGKSTLGRQLAVCVAAGIHPFDQHDVVPKRVLVVDLENPEQLSRRRYRPLWLQAAKIREAERHMWILSRPDGLDLTKPNDAAWLTSRVRKTRPDLLVIGPVYKMHAGDPNNEEVARQITRVIDYIRSKYRTAVLLEAHSPHGDGKAQRPLRPAGASLWRRWPDMGLGLRPVDAGEEPSADRMCELVRWKPRDERDWPRGLRAGETWPWLPVDQIEIDERRRRR